VGGGGGGGLLGGFWFRVFFLGGGIGFFFSFVFVCGFLGGGVGFVLGWGCFWLPFLVPWDIVTRFPFLSTTPP